ncbi:hypothetical protein AX774_g7924 [Zancudomyces culisetae]|uniref:Uncharacterized protein n=1 Tax=Zancudomyces culisetae TaxID=1213189 RepID=A0A1R1PCJ3_ZANCU|nr:hypothetical protein AX774_g7924 [Zancudomyces culisetae]|eukprot:OMH78680.1 hypothetical protein AX774_g7924 [Zancudomyces culisetae]
MLILNTRAENAGKLTINLTGLPLDPNANRIQAPAAAPSSFGVGSLDSHSVAIQNILTTLKSLLPAVVTIPLSISLLSRHPCTPSNEVCGLRSGLLQVCPLTLLAIDETTMDEGELKEQGSWCPIY